MSSQELDKLLGALREDTRGAEAPKHVEAALLSAFRTQAAKPVRPRWVPWTLGAAAAVAVLVGAGQWMMGQPVAPPPVVKIAMAPPPVIVLPALPAKVEAPLVAKRVRRQARPHSEAVKTEAPQVQEVATDFMPLEDSVSLPAIESGHILRVRLPQSTMMRFGFPMNPDRMMEPVKADVMFGQDGIARAVRFVR
jgi:hypothetical protein